jgi:hypothetical protein
MSDAGPFHYRPEILSLLETHGVRPRDDTAPDVARSVVRDLYNYELRRLRDWTRAGKLPRSALAQEVRLLRHKYVILSIPLSEWMES